MHSPGFDQSIPSSFLEQLKRQTNELQSRIVRANYNTQFAQTASELAGLRHAIAGLVDQMDDDTLSNAFRKTVQLTSYDSYAPLLARFFEKPCKASAIVDLLAPGLPDYVAKSSSTSGGLPKTFPKYNYLSEIRSSHAAGGLCTVSDPFRRRTAAHIFSLWCDQIDVEDDGNRHLAGIYVTSGSVVNRRMHLLLDPESDGKRMGTFILDHAAPYAAGFIKQWRSFLLIHALFALSSRSLETMSMVFISTFVEMIRHLDIEFDVVVDCIANGTIPDLDGLAEVRHYLESNISPDPERAAELRSLGRPSFQPGWCSRVWPNLHSIISVASGSFASYIPLVQWYLGPQAEIRPRGYGSAEAWIASPYNPLKLNQFKPNSKIVFEFLDVSKSDLICNITQLWEVEPGRRYELILTTKDGLWRYRIGDVVEICRFDPTDGIPIIQFVERRNAAIRFPCFTFTENGLRAAMSSVEPSILVKVVAWTAAIDDRRVPATIGFFVELTGGEVSDLARATEHILDELSRFHKHLDWFLEHGLFRKPTIRLVRSGTFSNFLQLKLDEGGNSLGQVKVPVVLPKTAYVTWFSNRVVQEF